MTLSRWQPFRELSTIRKQMDRLFEDMLSVSDRDWMGLHNMGGMWTPAVEIKEQDKELILKAEIPGIDAKDLEVEVAEDRVTLSGEHKEEKKTEDKEKNYFHSEFYYGKFERVIPLPVAVKTDEIKSDFEKGVLTLTLPKVEDAPKKSVKVKLEGS
ncbi:Hsp20/alpha crystallin family protein [Pleurocapsales cyanobacterium LEGE 10410]|nr:Hsp20/alpha crystallin family protein [Pleurocapsales cyanobacterium LEGE 10410]